MIKPNRASFETVETMPVINQTACYFYDLSHLTTEEFKQFIDEIKASGLLDDDEQT